MAILNKHSQASPIQTAVLNSGMGPYYEKIHSGAVSTFKSANNFLNRYPPIKAFVASFAATAAIPVAVFAGYSASTFAGVSAVAGTGVAIVQGGFIVFGTFILSWFILAALIIAAIFSFWFTLAYFAYSVTKKLEGI